MRLVERPQALPPSLPPDLSEYEEASGSKEGTMTPKYQPAATTPLPSFHPTTGIISVAFSSEIKRAQKIAESVKVKMFRGENLDGRDQDPEEFLDDVEFLAMQWSDGTTAKHERPKKNIRAFR